MSIERRDLSQAIVGVASEQRLSPSQLGRYVIQRIRAADAGGYFEAGWLDSAKSRQSLVLLMNGLYKLYQGELAAMRMPYIPLKQANAIVEAVIHAPDLYGIPMDGHKRPGWGVVGSVAKPWKKGLTTLDSATLTDAQRRVAMIQEERFPDEHGILEIVNAHKRNDRTRLVPLQPGVTISAEAGTCVDGYRAMDGMPLLYTVTRKQAQRVSYVIENAKRAGEEIVICIPTCPCDPMQADEGEYGVKFSGGALIEDGVSWTALNTVDALAVLVPEILVKLPEAQKIRLVFTLGDFEFESGSNRGMSKGDFMRAIEKNADALRTYVHDRLASSIATLRVQIDVRGIMSLVGGQEGWDSLRNEMAEKIDNFFKEASSADIERLLAVRRVIYESLREDGASSDDEVLAALKEDVLDYCVGDQAFRLVFDGNSRRSIVLAGDSRSMHQIAAHMTGSILLSVNGGYQGSL